MVEISEHFKSRQPSGIRLAQIEFSKRSDGCKAINLAIGNVSLPIHPAMRARMENLSAGFADGAVKYTATVGTLEANKAVLNIIESSGFDVSKLYSQITDGGSAAMELAIIGCCGAAGSTERPLMLIDAAYTNYISFCQRTGRRYVSVSRKLEEDGKFSLPDINEIDGVIEREKPGALVIIPYDNPTGQYFTQKQMNELARICVKHDIWIISDEAYRELQYTGGKPTSIWAISESDVPGISGRRISIETASKVWNACGLRIGALVTDNKTYHEKSVAEYTANLCANTIGQYIFGALADESHEDLQKWYSSQRDYYGKMMREFSEKIKEEVPGIIISSPDASLYSVLDVRNCTKPGFDALDFVNFCSKEGKVKIGSEEMTLLVAPMAGFYTVGNGEENPGKTQMRIAYVESPERMKIAPKLFAELLKQYEEKR